jgi:hypothetical protein
VHPTLSNVACLCLALAGCASENDLANVRASDEWIQADNSQVDILWVVDNSESMADEQDALALGFEAFVEELEGANTDFHLGVVSTDMEGEGGRLIGDPAVITNDDAYVDLFTDRVRLGGEGSQKEKGLAAALHALSPDLMPNRNRGFLREDAKLLVVMVSDEDDCSDDNALDHLDQEACYTREDVLVPVAKVLRGLRELKTRQNMVGVSAIVGPLRNEAACPQSTWPGHRYLSVARHTGGLQGDICEPDWGGMLYDLGLNASGVSTSFQTSQLARQGTIEVTVGGIQVPESGEQGWTYDTETLYLHFHGDLIPWRGSEIRCTYEVERDHRP